MEFRTLLPPSGLLKLTQMLSPRPSPFLSKMYAVSTRGTGGSIMLMFVQLMLLFLADAVDTVKVPFVMAAFALM